jgi:peptide/nickel transport system substrate-binding protein
MNFLKMGPVVLALFMAMGSVPSYGAMVKVGLMEEPKTLNVLGAKDIWASKVLLLSYQRLYYKDPSGRKLVPWLASDEPVWDPETKTITFHLREGTWDDGTPFTSEDVVFTAELITKFRIPDYWNNWNFVQKVEALDPRTVRLHLTKPMATVWERTLTSVIIQKSRWKEIAQRAERLLEDNLRSQEAAGKSRSQAYVAALAKPLELLTSYPVTKPESMGPFVMQQWQRGAYIHMRRNDNFFALNKEIDGHKVGPHVEGVIFKIYANTDTAILALKKGDIDYLWWGIESGYLEDLRANPNIRIYSSLKSGYRYLGFNLRKAPMNDAAFRRAVAYLVDKDFIVQRILHTEGCRLDTVVPPTNPQYCLHNPPLYGNSMSWMEKVEAAKKELKEAGYTWEVEPVAGEIAGQFKKKGGGLKLPGGLPVPPLNLLTPPADYDAQRAQTGNLIQQWLRDFGVPVNWRPMAFSALVKKVEAERDFDMFVSGWGALGHDPDYLRSFFHSRADVPEGKNACGYRNPEFDRIADLQVETMDQREREALVFKLQEILMKDLPYIPLYVPMNLEAVRADRFEGWVEMPGGIGNLWSFLQIRPKKR